MSSSSLKAGRTYIDDTIQPSVRLYLPPQNSTKTVQREYKVADKRD
jgi:hypothetical protein